MVLIKKACDALDNISQFICMLMTVILTVLVLVNAILRFTVDLNLLWAYDVCRVLFMFFVFFATAVVYRRGLHAKFVFIEERLPKKVALVIHTIFNLMYLAIFAVISVFAAQLSYTSRTQTQPASGLSAALYYVPLCLAFFVCFCFTIEFIIADFSKNKAFVTEGKHE